MPVIDTTTDTEALSVTITAHFAASVARVWQVYADPRQLKGVWRPPTFTATSVEHDLSTGGRMTYSMTSPEGERFGGWWQVGTVEEPNGSTFDDGFATADLEPDPTQPGSPSTRSTRCSPDRRTHKARLARVSCVGPADGGGLRVRPTRYAAGPRDARRGARRGRG